MRGNFRKHHATLTQEIIPLQIERHQISPNEYSPTGAGSLFLNVAFPQNYLVTTGDLFRS